MDENLPMKDDLAAAKFIGYHEVLHGRRGPGAFHSLLFSPSMGGAVVGQGGTLRAARLDAAAKAIAQDMAALLAAEAAIARATSQSTSRASVAQPNDPR